MVAAMLHIWEHETKLVCYVWDSIRYRVGGRGFLGLLESVFFAQLLSVDNISMERWGGLFVYSATDQAKLTAMRDRTRRVACNRSDRSCTHSMDTRLGLSSARQQVDSSLLECCCLLSCVHCHAGSLPPPGDKLPDLCGGMAVWRYGGICACHSVEGSELL